MKDATTTSALATYVPVFKALCGLDLSSPFTKNEPIIAAAMPTAERRSGNTAPLAP